MSVKLPYFQFYPGDWVQDTSALSLAAKGAWIDILCALWWSSNRGRQTLSMEQWARVIKSSIEQAKIVIDELVKTKICDHETDGNGNVTLISRRMEREEKERFSSRERVRKYREKLSNTDVTLLGNENVTPQKSDVRSQMLEKSKTKSKSWSPPAPEPVDNSTEKPKGRPEPGREPPKNDYQMAVNHVQSSYKAKKEAPYLFTEKDGHVVKRLSAGYGLFAFMALWDMFLEKNWDWKKDGVPQIVPHDLQSFQGKVRILVEDARWKLKTREYERKNQGAETVPKVNLKQISS